MFLFKKYKKFFLIFAFMALLIYSTNSLITIFNWIGSTVSLSYEYEILEAENEKILNEITILQLKTSGLQEENIDLDLLESRAKTILNKAKQKELIIIN